MKLKLLTNTFSNRIWRIQEIIKAVVNAHHIKHEEQIEKQKKRIKELEKENRMLIQNLEQNSIE